MKRSIVFLLLAILLNLPSAMAGIVIKTTLTIGRKSNSCNGFGICSITSSPSYTEGLINGTLDYNLNRGSLIISIYEKDLINVQPDKLVYLANKFTVDFLEDFLLDDEITHALHISDQLLIKKGSYELTKENGKYFITIPFDR